MTAKTLSYQRRPRRLTARPLISSAQPDALEHTFKVLANATRLRLLHALVKRPGLSVTALAQTVGMKPQTLVRSV